MGLKDDIADLQEDMRSANYDLTDMADDIFELQEEIKLLKKQMYELQAK